MADRDRAVRTVNLSEAAGVFDTELTIDGPIIAQIDNEMVEIVGVYWNGKTRLHVHRGQYGTTVTSHAPGTPITVYQRTERITQ